MSPALLGKVAPLGPWRSGTDSGDRARVDPIYHSDSLYSAVTGAMADLGELDAWLEATARSAACAAVRFSSCFPFSDQTLFVTPPRSFWPPPLSSKVRWKGARFVPLTLVDGLLSGDPLDEERWAVDGSSECLVESGASGPFCVALRSSAAVDRLGGAVAVHSTAAVEFATGAGLWAVVAFSDEAAAARWRAPVESALRLLGDSGLGGERSRGWGRYETPEFIEGTLPELLLPRVAGAAAVGTDFWEPLERAWWLLSLFAPAGQDSIYWERGNYNVVARGGRVLSRAGSGQLKKALTMVTEGSVLVARGDVRGAAADVAPDGFPHPVYRAGFALALPIPMQAAA